jgi:hypothetical protein
MNNSNLLNHAAASLIVIILSAVIFASVQQSYRSGANDPQLQLARDLRDRLANNQSVDRLFPADTVDLSRTLAVFAVLYDQMGEAVRSNALLDGRFPQLPKGVLDNASKKGENVLSWQPRKGIRMAMVVEAVPTTSGGYIAVGRSLAETEKRINNFITMLVIGLFFCLGVILVHMLMVHFRTRS